MHYVLYIPDLLTDNSPFAYSYDYATYDEALEEARLSFLEEDYRIVEMPEGWAPEYLDQYTGI